MYGFSVIPDLKGIALIAAGNIGILIFALYEMLIPSPDINISLLTKTRTFAFSNLSALINYSATYAVTFLLSLYLQYTKSFPPEYAGFILVVQPIVQAMISPIAGQLSDRVEPRIVASTGNGSNCNWTLPTHLPHRRNVSFALDCHSPRARCRLRAFLVP